MTVWIYVAGRGHSGTTMLDAMLGNSDNIESAGELISGMGRYKALCSCGESFAECNYWKEVRRRFEKSSGAQWDEAVQCLVRQAHLKSFVRTLLSTSRSKEIVSAIAHHNNIAETLRLVSGKPAILDSSKELTRATFIVRFISGAKVIHVVRHPVGVLNSHLNRLVAGSGFKMLRRRFYPRKWFFPFVLLGAAGWIVGNMLAEVIRAFSKHKVLRIRYEDLVDFPLDELGRMESFLRMPLGDLKEKIIHEEKLHFGHNIGGNGMRMGKGFTVERGKPSVSGLPIRYSIIIHSLCWPLIWKYGYYKK